MNTNANINYIYLAPTSSEDILKIITSMKGKQNSGHDCINSILLPNQRSTIAAHILIQ